MQEKLIDKITLENGLTLELFDRSRRVAGDRWLVRFVAHIDVEIRPEYFEGEHTRELSFEEIRAAVGEKATYSYEKQKNFVAEPEKDETVKGLKEDFLEATLAYLSGPDFARKLILAEYQKAKGHAVSWQRQ